MDVAIDNFVEETVVPGVQTPGSKPIVPPSRTAQDVSNSSFARGPRFTDRFPQGLPRRSRRQPASASASKEKGKKRVRIVNVESNDEVWNSQDDAYIYTALEYEKVTHPPKKKK